MACSTKSLREPTPARRRLSSHSFRCRGVTASPDFTRFSNMSGPPSGTSSDHPGNGPQSVAVSRAGQGRSTLFGTKPPKPPLRVVPPARVAGPVCSGRKGTFQVHAPLSCPNFGRGKRPQKGWIPRGRGGARKAVPSPPQPLHTPSCPVSGAGMGEARLGAHRASQRVSPSPAA